MRMQLQMRLQQEAGMALSLADQVYEHVKAALFDLQLLPGDHFTESDVVNAMGVSRTPVRQALQRLDREGFVQVSPRNGWQVRPFDLDRFEQLYDVRIILELAAVERLCRVPTDDGLAVLASLSDVWQVPQSQRLPAGRQSAKLDEAFHCSLVAATGNAELAAMHRDVTEKISIIRRLDFTVQDRVDATYEEHGAILDALRRRQAESAASLLRAHIMVSKATVRSITIHHLHSARKRDLGFLAR